MMRPKTVVLSVGGMKSLNSMFLKPSRTMKSERRAMPKRDLRVVKRTPIALGICERCNLQFSSNEPAEDDAEAEIWAQFDNHKCRSVDARPEHGKPASAEHGQIRERKRA